MQRKKITLSYRGGFTRLVESGIARCVSTAVIFFREQRKVIAHISMFRPRRRNTMPLFTAGFTMVEIMIMLSIIIIISAIVLVNFPSVSESINLQKSVQQFSLELRKTQNQALAVRLVQNIPTPVVPPAVGVYLSTANPSSYIVFADMNSNKVYDPGSDIVIETVTVERNVKISQLVDENNNNQSVVNIVFAVPDAQVTIYNASVSIGESVLVKFTTASGNLTRSVRMRTSGQIAIEQ